ncbi:serine/threonine-protein phosphatase [Sphingomonas naasensis]|uniref:Serine/threonine-protein phosphatase n=2 Tax=Sphingomonas naasensis TaxID=1344951 RepID=A0A4S1WA91_9SPHN|nr:protein phosphatase 2C domain-containing protein [Sphingomonas naasensis]TGX39333.1 serine/threonine-protein phosphatase [Sphingomonas naasensis]
MPDPSPPPPLSGTYRSMSRSHVGRVRKVNEDRVLDRPDRALWAIADGMGGHRGGDIAAELAIAALRGLADDPAEITPASIRGALEQANAAIFERGAAAGGVIGSTVVALHIAGGDAWIFWAGDSRAYRGEDGAWQQVTRDHSLVQQLVDQGLIDSAQAAHHPQANVITRALGVNTAVQIEALCRTTMPGDLFLLCSDGLSRSLDSSIPAGFGGAGEALADEILAGALDRDGSDNISFVLVTGGESRARRRA